MKLISISKYIEKVFVDGCISHYTIIRMIESGELPGKKMGGRWYVKLQPETTENELADRVLGL
ncbi:MAG: helix-turn-helix domain-containing protein [Gammaproteobacteria bacterium]|nr:helix-turn-helix domain-containing protein [Gammaproteobacteria bacterium]MCP3850105.1 helix-turn-helix domain-containing protein [Gammaproteobacteria bacterium]